MPGGRSDGDLGRGWEEEELEVVWEVEGILDYSRL